MEQRSAHCSVFLGALGFGFLSTGVVFVGSVRSVDYTLCSAVEIELVRLCVAHLESAL
jgi:hypothetical protein